MSLRYTLASAERLPRSGAIRAIPGEPMSEILTESFCERCGTRYTFESARPKVRLKSVKVLSRGLKNFVLSDDTTMDEAMAAARSETDREVTAHQLDAFHTTFNFCMSCRQYTCPNCWNEVQTRCLSCAPLPGQESLATPFPGLAALAGTTIAAEPSNNGTNGHLQAEVPSDGGANAEPEAVVAVEPESATAAEPATSEPAEKAANQTAGLLRRFRPGQSLDDELAAYELARIDPEPHAAAPLATDIEVVVSSAEPVAGAGPEPVVAAGLEPEPEVLAPAADVVEQPTWRITAPDTASPPDRQSTRTDMTIPPRTSGSPLAPTEPQWPAKPEWPAARASAGLPFLGRPTRPQGGVDALWAASNEELVATQPTPGRSNSGIQPCISCGLSLSATARFCRRCGTLQGG